MLLCEYNLERYPEVPFSVKCNSEDIIPSALLVIHIKKKDFMYLFTVIYMIFQNTVSLERTVVASMEIWKRKNISLNTKCKIINAIVFSVTT